MPTVIWARVESEMFRLQPVGVGEGPVGNRVVTAHRGGVPLSVHGGPCLDEKGFARLWLGEECFMSITVV